MIGNKSIDHLKPEGAINVQCILVIAPELQRDRAPSPFAQMFNSCQDERSLIALFTIWLDDARSIEQIAYLPVSFLFTLRLE